MRSLGVIIYGASGHGKVVADALIRSGRVVAGFLDDNAVLHGREFFGIASLAAERSSPNSFMRIAARLSSRLARTQHVESSQNYSRPKASSSQLRLIQAR